MKKKEIKANEKIEIDQSKKEELQQRYIELQLLNQQIVQLQKQLTLIDQQAVELVELKSNLDEVVGIGAERDILFPIGAGVFLKGRLTNTKEALINVGNGVVLQKDIFNAKEIVSERIDELNKIIQQIESSLLQASLQSQYLEYEIGGFRQ